MEKQDDNKHNLLVLSSMGAFDEFEPFSDKHVYDHFFPYLYSLNEDEVRLLSFLEFYILKQNQFAAGMKVVTKYDPKNIISTPGEQSLNNTRIIAEAANILRNSLLKRENADKELIAFLEKYSVKREW